MSDQTDQNELNFAGKISLCVEKPPFTSDILENYSLSRCLRNVEAFFHNQCSSVMKINHIRLIPISRRREIFMKHLRLFSRLILDHLR